MGGFPPLSYGISAGLVFTFGGNHRSHLDARMSAGVSTRFGLGFGSVQSQVGLNLSGNLTTGGLGHSFGKRDGFIGELALSPSLTIGGGYAKTSAPLNTFHSGALTSVFNNFQNSFTHAQNLSFSTKHGYQRVGAYALRAGDFNFHTYNDTRLFLGDKKDRFYSGGGGITIVNFLGNSENSIIITNDVFTGNSYNSGKWKDRDKKEPEYQYGGKKEPKFLRYANQSDFDDLWYPGYNQSLNMGQTSIRVNSSFGVFQLGHSGEWDMWSQNGIHDAQDFHRFLSTVKNQIEFSYEYMGWEYYNVNTH
jgi:hypothetical protein